MEKPRIISGEFEEKTQGIITYNNDFDMKEVKRGFVIAPSSEYVQREWHGHKIEQNWFYPISGLFLILVVVPDDWKNPSFSIKPLEYIIAAEKNEVLHIPAGYVTKIKALKENSRLMVYSNFTLEESLKDDYRFQSEIWDYGTFF